MVSIISRIVDDKEELLQEHIENCLQTYNTLLRSSKIKKIIDPIADELKLAIIFHDSGKIFYQIIKIKRDGGSKKISFLGHEIFSCYIFDSFIHALYKNYPYTISLDLEKFKYKKFLIDSLILYHHYAMNIDKRFEKLYELLLKNELFLFQNPKEFLDILNEHAKIIVEFLTKCQISFLKVNSEILNHILNHINNKCYSIVNSRKNLFFINEIVRYINKEMWNLFVKNNQFKRDMVLGTSILNVIDTLSVKMGKKTRFRDILEDFVNIYQNL